MYMLIDCDNFFVSCERVFQPHLNRRPVVVLSNNDGCVVSRSDEAKQLGIAMCAPYFKIERLLKSIGGIALSSNYELYADLSRRIMTYLRQTFSGIEVYSIDEAFVSVSGFANYYTLASQIRQNILQYFGIPVSIGIAATKTLCKIASRFAKRQFKLYQLTSAAQIREQLAQTDIIDLWGVGRHLAPKLNHLGIFTAADLATMPLAQARSAFGIGLTKTIMELNQTPAFELETPELSQSLISSGSFETEIQNRDTLEANLAEFVDCACLRLRQQKAVARGIWISVYSNRFNLNHPQYNNSCLISLPTPSCNTANFMTAMRQGLDHIYRPDCWYKRAGVTLIGLEKADALQTDLLQSTPLAPKEQKLMSVFDELNRKFGRKTVYYAVQNKTAKSYLKREFRSPAFTTSWQDLPLVF